MTTGKVGLAGVLCAGVAFYTTLPAQRAPPTLVELLADPTVKAALDTVKSEEPQALEDLVRFCEVPAPPFGEQARGELLRETFQQLGLRNTRIDKSGNVLGERPGTAPHPHLVMSAHLDTVFPAETDVRVRRDGMILRGPGTGDDCRGLAVLVSVIRALRHGHVQTPGSITFVATVGEEGLGDLRGVKQLFRTTLAGEIDRFVAIDGTGLGITNVGVGSLRYRITFKGPGGHSFAAFGLASPIDAMGRAIARIAEFQVPTDPRTTFNVGRVGGGTSVNAIAAEAWMEVDLRSSDPPSLAALDARLGRAIEEAVADENTRWRTPQVISAVKIRVGDRPPGSTPSDSAIVRTTADVQRALGLPFALSESSTDANIPMSLRIPAISIGAGGRGTDAHALTESFDTTDSWIGTRRAVLLTIALAQK